MEEFINKFVETVSEGILQKIKSPQKVERKRVKCSAEMMSVTV